MSEPNEVNLSVVENDTFVRTFELVDADTGSAINLTGATAKMQVRTTYGAASPSLTFEIGGSGGLTIPTPTNGRIVLSKTANVVPGNYVYDLQVTFAGSVVRTVARGMFVVLDEVTT